MNRKRRLYCHLAAGIVLAIGPVWARVGSILAMVGTFSEVLKNETVNPEVLAAPMSFAFYLIIAGDIALPIGIILIVVTAIRLSKDTQIQTETLTSGCTEPPLRTGR